MPSRRRLALVLSGLITLAPAARAAIETSALPAPSLQLIVIEVPGCFYCRLFRRDVLPAYAATPNARRIPMRVIDLKAAKARKLSLARPIDVVPTVVLLRGGKEIGRIPGYLARENFLRSINYLLSHAE